MMKRLFIAAGLVVLIFAPSRAQDTSPAYDFRERTRALAFDPARFFPEQPQTALSIRYVGDDYAFPVYSIAVRRGCVDTDQGDARRTCGTRLTARMVRSPYKGDPPRPRARGQKLFAVISQMNPKTDDALRQSLDMAGLEWLETDIRNCQPAMNYLSTSRSPNFFSAADLSDPSLAIVLHADKVTFEVYNFLEISRYVGWLKPGSPAVWANNFADSLRPCWRRSTAVVPWRIIEK